VGKKNPSEHQKGPSCKHCGTRLKLGSEFPTLM